MNEADARIQTICLTILTALALGWVLAWARPVMLPFVLAVFIVLALSPIVDLLVQRARCPRPMAISGTLMIGIVLLSAVGVTISMSVASLVANAGTYQRQIRLLIDATLAQLPLEYFGVDPQEVLAQLPLNTVSAVLIGTGNALVDILSQGMLVLVFVIFLLIGGHSAWPTGGPWGQIRARVKRYIVTKVVISMFTGASVGVILTLLGIPLAGMFGLLAFLLNFIPSFGSIIATLAPLPIILVNPDIQATAGVLAIVLPAAVQLTLGNFVEPKIMGESLDLHPVVILMSLVFWGMLWGIAGMFLSVPMTAVLQIFLERMEHTRPIADVMAGRLDRVFREE